MSKGSDASRPTEGRRAAGPAITSSDALYRLLVESVVDYAIFALDATGHVLNWNRGAARLKGYDAADIIGQHFSVFYPPEDRAARKPDRELEIAVRDGRLEDEGWRIRADGSRFRANVIITPLRNEAGEVISFAKVTRDLTDRRQAEEESRRRAAAEAARKEAESVADKLTELNERLRRQAIQLAARTTEARESADALERTNEALQDAVREAETSRDLARAARVEAETANRAKADFLATMSHELRTPLNAIAGYAELLEMGLHGPVTEGQLTALSRIERSRRHLQSLIEDILNFARIEAGHLALTIADVPLRDLITDLEPLIAPQVQARGLRLDFTDCDASLMARADGEKVRQILLNLLSNAVKFTPAGGKITLTGEQTAEGVSVRVRDTGNGIPTDKLSVIFDPFVQVGRGLNAKQEGAGLGLSISRRLARAMGGELSVESRVGVGSTFTLLLPAGGSSQPMDAAGG